MRLSIASALLMSLVVAVAAGFRLVSLDNRPMHCDEAGQALKFGRLLEQGEYVYDPYEYHGPSLNYLTLPVARLAKADRLTQVTETHLRLLPAVFGIVLVGLVWLVRDELGCMTALWAAALTAVSPAMVFYSRYYIQETLFVCFTFGAIVSLWRYRRNVAPTAEATPDRRAGRLCKWFWLLSLGSCLGMMHATKETCVIPMFAMGAAALAVAAPSLCKRFRAWAGGGEPRGSEHIPAYLLPASLVILTAACVSMLLFSSFFANPPGVIDSIGTYSHYFHRASGEGSAGPHDHPWYYYLQLLFWWHRPGGAVWSEAPVALLALIGFGAAAIGRGLQPANLPAARFMAVYTLLMTAIYSAVPYKTPWCALGFYHGMILLAGIGAAVLIHMAPWRPLKAVAALLVAAAIGWLAWQSWLTSFVDHTDPDNPYVYAHTTADVPLLAERIESIAQSHPDAEAMHIQVICPDDDHWPLPWYMRRLTRVDWFSQASDGPAAPLIVTQPQMEPALIKMLYETPPPGRRYLYVPLPTDEPGRDWRLRPGVPLRVYMRLELWQAYGRKTATDKT